MCAPALTQEEEEEEEVGSQGKQLTNKRETNSTEKGTT